MADARVNDQGLQNEFVQGFTEAREATTNVGYRVRLRFEGTVLRQKVFDTMDEALRVVAAHLAQGAGCSVEIVVCAPDVQESSTDLVSG